MRPLEVPIICLVTDRRRLPAPHGDSLVRLAADAAAAGVSLIHLRERDLDDRQLLALTRRIVSAAAGTGAAVVVNERVDVALAAGAAGVHLRADSLPAARVRSIVPPGFLIGRSIHAASEARTAGDGADYLAMGTVYPSRSKSAGAPVAGVAGLAAACAAGAVPVLAIGGVTCGTLGELARAGAAGVAAIGMFSDCPARDGGSREPAFRRVVAAVREAFGSRAWRRGGVELS
jgi:thiamine-phosphate pyrophosphorylase